MCEGSSTDSFTKRLQEQKTQENADFVRCVEAIDKYETDVS
jgi:hypothetical protein